MYSSYVTMFWPVFSCLYQARDENQPVSINAIDNEISVLKCGRIVKVLYWEPLVISNISR